MKSAMAETMRTIEQRSRVYRRIVMLCILGVGPGTVVAALISGLRGAFIAAITIVPVVGLLLVVDRTCVFRWQAKIHGLVTAGLSWPSFKMAGLSHPLLPQATFRSMAEASDWLYDPGAPNEADKILRSQWRAAVGRTIAYTLLLWVLFLFGTLAISAL